MNFFTMLLHLVFGNNIRIPMTVISVLGMLLISPACFTDPLVFTPAIAIIISLVLSIRYGRIFHEKYENPYYDKDDFAKEEVQSDRMWFIGAELGFWISLVLFMTAAFVCMGS